LAGTAVFLGAAATGVADKYNDGAINSIPDSGLPASKSSFCCYTTSEGQKQH
jgi:hypothetical protein